jgi:thiamine pyrophosphate-dependent acetolactate synthase large subunit-like protein
VCLATSGPGGIHLLNGLYDAKMDQQPVLAITGMQFNDVMGTYSQQDVELDKLFMDVACYNNRVMSAPHMEPVIDLAIRSAIEKRQVAHITIPIDVQSAEVGKHDRSERNRPHHTSSRNADSGNLPPMEDVRAAAEVINKGKRIAILAGQGALHAGDELLQLAELLGAPIVKPLLGKGCVPDDSPYTTGGIGHLGTAPSEYIMHACDTLLILGSTMPWVNAYPKPGQARAIQVDLKPEHIGIRYPVEISLVSDVKATVAALLPLINAKDAAFLREAQSRMRDWRALLDRVCATARTPLRPQMVMRELSAQLAPDAVISLDCGANTHFAARIIELKAGQKLTGTGMLATMAPGLPFAIAAQLAFPSIGGGRWGWRIHATHGRARDGG